MSAERSLALAPSIAAFFDLDGTLLTSPPLERRFLRFLYKRGEVGVVHATRWLGRFLERAWRNGLAATEGNKAHLAGVAASAAEAFLATCHGASLEFFPEAFLRLAWHEAQGHRVFLVTGTLGPLARGVARYLPISITVCATELEVADGRWTGRVPSDASVETEGEALCGPAKGRALEHLASEYQLNLRRSYAYGNASADRWMLECVGYPAAVNPSPRLAVLARRRGWPVLEWGRRGAKQDSRPNLSGRRAERPGKVNLAERGLSARSRSDVGGR
ncbi:MAG TPA: HAD family phosphatase [Candidatus Acidoferrales bacterium]|nr:HAD family phosphatase [Candidatus Acidoferrales bacterium]